MVIEQDARRIVQFAEAPLMTDRVALQCVVGLRVPQLTRFQRRLSNGALLGLSRDEASHGVKR